MREALKRRKRRIRRAPVICVVIAFITFVYSFVMFVAMQVEILQKQNEYAELQEKLSRLELENEQLDHYIKEGNHLEYIENIARDELNLSYTDEKIYYFIPKE